VHSTDLEPIPVDGSRTPPRTTPARCTWETAVWLDPVRAVGVIDSLLGLGLTTRHALADIAARHADWPGGQRARKAFDLADPGAQSPPESHLRVRLVLGGLPRPVTQHPVVLPSGLMLHPDLAWPRFKVAVEYDGHWHADPDRLHHDRQRLNQLVGAGWVVLHVTSRRLQYDFPGVLGEVRSALRSRRWRP
jgi:very-short-patch-repair endonuclease